MQKIKIPEICDQWHDSGMFHVSFPYPKTDYRFRTADDPFEKWCKENNIGFEPFNRKDVKKSDNHVFVESEIAYQIFESQKEKMILTDGGNLLRHCELGWYFQKPNGEFLREVSEDEATFLAKNGHEIDFHFPNKHPNEFPVWKFLKSIRTCNDYSDYKAETSCNGGDYAHYVNQDWFVGKVNGKTVFRYVPRFATSSEFGYDELAGNYQQDLGSIHVSNASVPERYITQCQYWDQELQENVYDVYEVLEKISEIGTFEQFWNATCVGIPSKYEPDEEEFEYPSISLTDKKLIIHKLKDFGINIREDCYRSKNPKKGWVKSTNRR